MDSFRSSRSVPTMKYPVRIRFVMIAETSRPPAQTIIQADQGTVKEAPHQPDQSEERVLHCLLELRLHQLTGQLGHGGYLRAKKLFVEGADPRGGCPVSALGPHRRKSRQARTAAADKIFLLMAFPSLVYLRYTCPYYMRLLDLVDFFSLTPTLFPLAWFVSKSPLTPL